MNKYKIFKKYKYKNFHVTLCFYKKYLFSDEESTAFIRNNKWKNWKFIMLTEKDMDKLKRKVTTFLKNPDLSEAGINRLKITTFSHNYKEERAQINKDDNEWLEQWWLSKRHEDSFMEDISSENQYYDEIPYDSIEDTHSLEWNEHEEEWSNEEDF